MNIQEFGEEPPQIEMLDCKETETGRTVILSF